MDFRFTPEEEAFREELVTFLEESLPPDWSGGDFPADGDEDWEFTLSMRKKLAQKGWLAMHWPKEYGGAGLSPMEQFIFKQEE